MKQVIVTEAINGYIITIEEEQSFQAILDQFASLPVPEEIKGSMLSWGNALCKLGVTPKRQHEMVARDKQELLKILESVIGGW